MDVLKEIDTGQLISELMSRRPDLDAKQLLGPELAASYILDLGIQYDEQENLLVVSLNTKNKPLIHHVYRGQVSAIHIRLAEVFRDAVRDGATSILVAHNHPSGDPTPSPEDIRVTQKMVEAGKLLDINVLDHIVVSAPYQYHSIKAQLPTLF